MNEDGNNVDNRAETVPSGRTLAQLIDSYQTDPVSRFHKLRYQSRQNSIQTLRRLRVQYGDRVLSTIRARDLKEMHMRWSEGGKLALAHQFMAQLRSLSSYGLVDLEDQECERISLLLSKLKFPNVPPRLSFLTAQHVVAFREKAHWRGWYWMAMAQAIQFELMLRQKDVIGEWVPLDEPVPSDLVVGGFKWTRGLRWEEIDDDLILRHVTSKRQKLIEIDLKKAPMVLEEFAETYEVPVAEMTRAHLPPDGPVILCEITGYPYLTTEFRRKWRKVADMAGIPKSVKNMDSRAGAITEATEAGADIEHVKHAATHSDINMTQRYSRNATAKIAGVQETRVKFRDAQKVVWRRDQN